MRSSMLVAFALGATSLGVAHAAAIEHAEGQSVHRCIGEHGEITFSGSPCVGTAAPPAAGNANSAMTGSAPTSTTSTVCPATLDALRDAIAAAFVRRDANVIAGLMRWDGIGGGAARERMRELATMTASPLLGIDMQSDAPGARFDDGDADQSRDASHVDRIADDDVRDGEGDAHTVSDDPRGAAGDERFVSSDPRYRAHGDRDARSVSNDPRDNTESRGDDETAPRPQSAHAQRLAPGTVDIRTGGELGARDNTFRIVPAGGCYWLDW